MTDPQPSSAVQRENASPAALDCTDLHATVGAFHLGPISLTVRAGEAVCLLGANGAGKTTLLSCLLGLRPLTGGTAHIAGHPTTQRHPRWLREIGVVPDDADELIGELTALEHWRLHASLRADHPLAARTLLEQAQHLARALQFTPDPGALISGYSHGMRKKTQLIAALMDSPAVVIVDEPRNGLDPAGIAIMERLLAERCHNGGAVLAASHDLHWAERIADRVAILAGGSIVALGPPDTLTQPGESFTDAFFRLTASLPDNLA